MKYRLEIRHGGKSNYKILEKNGIKLFNMEKYPNPSQNNILECINQIKNVLSGIWKISPNDVDYKHLNGSLWVFYKK